MDTDLFTYDPGSGLDYVPAEDPTQSEIEGGNLENGVSDVLSDPQDIQSDLVQNEEGSPESDILAIGDSGNSDSDVLLQQIAEVQVETYAIDNPVSGSLSSATLDYFDRVANGLPEDYTYLAYKTSEDDSYSGSLIYGKHVDVSGKTVIFGNDSTELRVARSSSGGRYYINYYSSDASGSTVNLDSGSTILYYSNAVPGLPTLGDHRSPSVLPSVLGALFFGFVLAFVLRRFFKRGQ